MHRTRDLTSPPSAGARREVMNQTRLLGAKRLPSRGRNGSCVRNRTVHSREHAARSRGGVGRQARAVPVRDPRRVPLAVIRDLPSHSKRLKAVCCLAVYGDTGRRVSSQALPDHLYVAGMYAAGPYLPPALK